MSLMAWIWRHGLASWAEPRLASLAFALAYVAFWWALMALLYRRGIFLKV